MEPIEKKEEPKAEPNEALNLLKEISEKVSAPKEAPASQPAADPMKVYNDRKADIMKQMGWNEAQFNFHETEKVSAMAPIMKEMAMGKIERAHKDYDKLKDPFEKEIKRYETEFKRVITPELAEEVFYMVKGREMSAGRFKPEMPETQPKKPRDTKTGTGEFKPRISEPYRDTSGMSSRDGDEGGGGDAPQISERELAYVAIFGKRLLPEQYVKMREEKKAGIRAISDRSFRAPDIDIKSAGPADRALAQHWQANNGELL